MAETLRVLILEDRPSDARLLVAELQRAGFKPEWERVETEPDYLARLSPDLDVILSDYSMPQFDAPRALELLKERGLEVPFVVVSGTIGEETAVAAMQAGAADYLLKDRLGRLGQVINRALEQRQLREQHRRAQQALRENEQRTRLILDTAYDPFLCMDAGGVITDWNAQAEAVFGWSRAEVLGRRVDETIVPPRHRAAHEAGLLHYLATGEGPFLNRRVEVAALRRGGEEIPVELMVWPVRVGETVTFSAFVRDITAHKQAERELLERARLAALSADVGLALTRSDTLRESLGQCAASMVRNLGAAFARVWTLNEREGVLELQASAGLYTHLDGPHSRVPLGDLEIGRIAQEGVPHLTNDVLNDPGINDREWARREGMVAFAGYPLLVEDRLVGVMALFARERLSESTLAALASVANQIALGIERKRGEESLRETNQTLGSLILACPLAVVALDRDSRVVLWSPAAERIFGWAEREVVGQPVPFIPPEEWEEVQRLIREEFAGETRSGVELRRLRKDGTPIDVSLWTAPLQDATGDVIATMGLLADRTAQKLLEAQFRQAQKMEAVGRLAGGVAHDFNNLLTVINGYGMLTLDNLHEGDPLRNPIEQIVRAGERAALLTRQLLAFSRRQVVVPIVLDVNGLLADIKKLLGRLIGEDIDLVVRPGPELWKVKADPGQMEQVVMNLVVNSRDAMPTGGKLTIETQNVEIGEEKVLMHPEVRPGEYVLVAVSDTGSGMDSSVRAQAFDPFFTTKGPEKGTGLGLATVYGIVRAAGGHIEVYSEVGAGTTVKVYLPRDREGAPAGKSYPPPKAAARGTETVLLAEDEDGVRALARHVLQQNGYRVLEARHGGEALLICEQHRGRIDLLVTDVVMPSLSGRQVAERLVGLRPEMKVLYLSGYTDDAVVRHGVLEEEAAFLQKPFTPAMLALKVREVLDE